MTRNMPPTKLVPSNAGFGTHDFASVSKTHPPPLDGLQVLSSGPQPQLVVLRQDKQSELISHVHCAEATPGHSLASFSGTHNESCPHHPHPTAVHDPQSEYAAHGHDVDTDCVELTPKHWP
eukprot:TRINITY_DN3860_c0_g1_i1.p2 TRINITY_DN3860_c0_g1~~TRINITY_DN3860_c0_g1_i1.p2  ORF type:complete len:121 (+),score=10.46 TRINITY_DN3860_c0_g1_i1:161-523(+)